jgi:hypothetical protein
LNSDVKLPEGNGLMMEYYNNGIIMGFVVFFLMASLASSYWDFHGISVGYSPESTGFQDVF